MHVLTLGILLSLFLPAFGGRKILTAEPGQDVTLPCRVPDNNKNIIAVEWSRADLKSEYVLLFRDDQLYLEGQHPSFKNRVDLQDRQMKDGDVSLILKDVTTDDGGTYECRVKLRGTNRRKRANLKTPPTSIIILSVPPPEQKLIKAEPGQNVTLRCRVPNNKYIIGVEWSRTDLKPEEYVLLFRDGQLFLEGQHPSYKNRVDLQDRQMTDGDVSLILKDVTPDDGGTYECRVKLRGTNRRKRANLKTPPISIINLEVSGHTDGSRGNGEDKDRTSKGKNGRAHYGLIVSVIIFTVTVIALFVKYKKRLKENSKIPSPSENSVFV